MKQCMIFILPRDALLQTLFAGKSNREALKVLDLALVLALALAQQQVQEQEGQEEQEEEGTDVLFDL